MEYDYKKFWHRIYNATHGEAIRDGHHFTETDNFCVDNGIRIIDYGSPRTQEIILKNGDKIIESLK